MRSSIVIRSKIKDYSVEFVLSLNDIINLIHNTDNSILCIDKNIASLFPDLVNDKCIVINCIENHKNLSGCEYVYNEFAKYKTNIKTKIIAIGGGILQDIVGFCASTYCRGIDYTLIPTTLLAQADSCIGGKTSLNFNNKKNILGTFYPPNNIIICTDFLKTLKKIDFISGLGEIYKFHILQNKILSLDKDIFDHIYNGLKYKSNIISKDEFDTKERKILNFGHTFGHALEISSLYEIPHGIAVIIGSMISMRLSRYYGYLINHYDHFIDIGLKLINESSLSFKKDWFDFSKLLEIAMSDKKNTGNLVMILINQQAVIQTVSEYNLLEKAIKDTYESL